MNHKPNCVCRSMKRELLKTVTLKAEELSFLKEFQVFVAVNPCNLFCTMDFQ